MSTPQNGPSTLQQLVYNVEMATSDFTALSLDVSAHLGNIAKERVALGHLRERLIVIREPVARWQEELWETSWQFESPSDREVWLSAHGKARDLHALIDRLIWGLFDFRKPVAEGGTPP